MDILFSADASNVPPYRSVNETNSSPQSLARGFIVSLISAALFGAIAGVVMMAMGLAMITGQLSVFALWLLKTFPVLSTIG
jgi:hypothetical protein